LLDAKINRAFQFWFTDAKIFSCTCFSRTCAICNSLLYFSILYSLFCISLFCIVLGLHLLGVAVNTFWAYRSAPFGRSGRHLLGVPYALFGRTAPLFLGVPLCRFSAKWPKKNADRSASALFLSAYLLICYLTLLYTRRASGSRTALWLGPPESFSERHSPYSLR